MSFLPSPKFFSATITITIVIIVIQNYYCNDDKCWCSSIFEDVWHLTAIYTNRLGHTYLLADISFAFCQSQALVNNPKIEVRDGTYGFKPKYNLKDKKALLRLLDKHDQLGLGGVLLDDVEEGLPNSAKAIKVAQETKNESSKRWYLVDIVLNRHRFAFSAELKAALEPVG